MNYTQVEIEKVRVPLSQGKRILKAGLRNRRGIWLLSSPGVGKTSIVRQALGELAEDGISSKLIIKNPAFENPIDSKGIVPPVDDPSLIDFYPIGEMKYLFEDGPEVSEDLIVVFLDDFGNATDAVKQAYMPFLCDTGDDRWIGGRKLRSNVVFVVASNTKSDKSNVRGMLYSVTGRAPCILWVYPDADEWVDWAFENDVPMSVISWVKFDHSNLLEDVPATNDFEKKSNPRNVQYLAEIVRDWDLIPDDKLPSYCGAVGDTKGVNFAAWEEIWENLPEYTAVINNPDGAAIPETTPGAMWALAGMLAQNMNLGDFDNAMRYTSRFTDKEFQVFFVLSAVKLHEELLSTSQYVTWQRENPHLYRNIA